MNSNRAGRRRRTTRRLGRRRPLRVSVDDAGDSATTEAVEEALAPGAEEDEAKDAAGSAFEVFDDEGAAEEEDDLDVRDTQEMPPKDRGGDGAPADDIELDVDETSQTLPRMQAVDPDAVEEDAEVDAEVDAETQPRVRAKKARDEVDDKAAHAHDVVVLAPARVISDPPPPRPEPAKAAPEPQPESARPTEVDMAAPRLPPEPEVGRVAPELASEPPIEPPEAAAQTEPASQAVAGRVVAERVPGFEAEATAAAESGPESEEPGNSAEPEFVSPRRRPRQRQDSADFVLLDVEEEAESEEAQHRLSRTPPPPPPDARAKPKRPPPPPPPAPSTSDGREQQRRVRQWWERFFSDDYLMSVLPPTEAQIARQVDFVEQSLGLSKGATVLDVGCGLGLHSLELARRGHLAVGLDLSLTMITRAAEEAQQRNLRINFLHADIREIEFDGTFDGVLCLGTTFGFFDDEANRDVLSRLYQALKPGGRILIDVVNRDYVLRSQPNLVWFEGDECVCMEESDFNYFSSRLAVKRTMMGEDGRQSEAEYSIRLYSLHELGQLMQSMGFRVMEVSGQEATRGTFFGSHSQRILMLGERRVQGRHSTMLSDRVTGVTGEIPKPPDG